MSHVYLGQTFHKYNADDYSHTDKKIGISIDVPRREKDLNPTNMPIGYAMLKYWFVGPEYKKTEAGIHALLDDDRYTNTEWFRDPEHTLNHRLTNYMKIRGYQQVLPDVTEATFVEKQVIEQAVVEGNRENAALLVGETFYHTRFGMQIATTCQTEKQWISTIGTTILGPYTSGSKACVGAIRFCNDATGNPDATATIHFWTYPRNENGQTPDDVCNSKKSV